MTATRQERRAIVLHPSLNRPRLIMGMDPTLFMVLTLAVVFLTLGFQLRPLPTALGLALGAVGYPLLRRLAKDDPLLWLLYLEHTSFQGFYRAHAQLEARAYRPDRSVRSA